MTWGHSHVSNIHKFILLYSSKNRRKYIPFDRARLLAISIFVTDCELALMNASTTVFLNGDCLLCRLHILKKMLGKQRRKIYIDYSFQRVDSAVEHSCGYIDRKILPLADMRKTSPVHNMAYLKNTGSVYKARFVAALMSFKRQFGHSITSKVRSTQSALNEWVVNLTANLLTVKSACPLVF